MERKLVSIQKISKLEIHPNADTLEIAHILGWRCVVKKGEFCEGALILYFEIDSFLPIKPEFEWLRKSCYRKFTDGREGFRIKTIKLRQQISQGLILKLDLLPVEVTKVEEGMDVTELMGVVQYNPPVPECIKGTVKGNFPSFIPKTDETRVQLLANVLTRHQGTECYVTEKVDGCLHYREKIKTDMGEIEIGKIVNQKLPVKILTYNEEKSCCEYKPIEKYHKYNIGIKKWIRIGVGSRGKGNREKYIDCTNNHHFLTPNGWTESKNLKVGEIVYHYVDNLNEPLKEIILGCLIGDSSIRKQSENYMSVAFGHSTKQRKYFEYKEKLFGNLFIRQKNEISGFGSEMLRGMLKTNLSLFNLLKEICLINHKKIITKEWINKLTPLSLAFWYMDDGSISHREEIKQKPKCVLNTQGYSYETNLMFKEMFKSKFNINVSIGNKGVYKGYNLLFNKEDCEKLCSLIAPYVCPNMKYKLPKKFESWKCCLEGISFGTDSNIIETKILSIKNLNHVPLLNNCYDLSVKDNHNYFAYNILVHNSSVTYFINKGEFGVCSRNLELKEDEKNAFWEYAKKADIENKLRKLNMNIALQGELIGPNIQENRLQLNERKVLFFNVFDINKYAYLDYSNFILAIDALGLETVPLVNNHFYLIDNVDEIVKFSIGKSIINPKKQREGIVIRPLIEQVTLEMSGMFNNGRLSFKAINPEYLLENDE